MVGLIFQMNLQNVSNYPASQVTPSYDSPFEAVDIYKIMKWKLLMKRDEAGELLGICEM